MSFDARGDRGAPAAGRAGRVAPGPALTIDRLALRVGLPTSLLRFYEDAGVLPAVGVVNGRRRYGLAAVDLLFLIRFCHELGFTAAELRELLPKSLTPASPAAERDFVDAKVVQLAGLTEQASIARPRRPRRGKRVEGSA